VGEELSAEVDGFLEAEAEQEEQVLNDQKGEEDGQETEGEETDPGHDIDQAVFDAVVLQDVGEEKQDNRETENKPEDVAERGAEGGGDDYPPADVAIHQGENQKSYQKKEYHTVLVVFRPNRILLVSKSEYVSGEYYFSTTFYAFKLFQWTVLNILFVFLQVTGL